MSQELSQSQLERMVQGEMPDPNCVFYEQSKLDVEKSKAAGRRIYSTVLMVKYTQPGVTDWAPQRAQKADIRNNPEAYAYFERTKNDVGSPSVDMIPGIHPNEAQELIDYGIITITKLCEAQTLPAHLQHLQASARRLNEVLKHEQESNEKAHQTEEMLATDRRNDTVGMRPTAVSRSPGTQVGSVTGGLREGGRLDGGEGRTGQEDRTPETRCEEVQKVDRWDSPNWSLSIG
jgi:hypothetical protein